MSSQSKATSYLPGYDFGSFSEMEAACSGIDMRVHSRFVTWIGQRSLLLP